MFRVNPVNTGRAGITGPVMVLLALVILTLAGGNRIADIETTFYDFLQRQQSMPGSDRIVVVTTDGNASGQGSIWEPEPFRKIVNALNDAGAMSIVPIDTPPANSTLPDFSSLEALVELEKQARKIGGPNGEDNLAAELARIRELYEQQARMESTVEDARNIVLPLSASDSRSASESSQVCANHAISVDGPDSPQALTGMKSLNGGAPPAGLCKVAATAGIGAWWPDQDSVVRRTHLLVNSGGLVFPALAVASLLTEKPGQRLRIDGPDRIELNGSAISTAPGYASLNRFYSSKNGEPPFKTISAEAILSGQVPDEAIRGRVVVLGSIAGTERYRTPVAQDVPAATMLATSLSNLLEMDFVLRPNWFRWAEFVLLLVLAAAVLVAIPTMSVAGAAIAAGFLGGVLLMTEAYLFMAEGIWIKMVTPALFTVVGIGCLKIIHWMFAGLVDSATSAIAPQGMAVAGVPDQLDLEFSVLRQQPPTDDNKEKLYKIATEHGKRKEFAKAERVLRHLASLDPEYRNVNEKLRKLSGSRVRKTESDVDVEQLDANGTIHPPAGDPSDRKKLGRYEVDQILGRGAMATVYLGRDPNINRRVAIKTIALSEEFSDEDLVTARNQFMREAESAGRLNHPNIIAIYDAGEDGGVAYLAMEYFEGRPLSEHARADNLLPPKWVLELTARAAEALHYAHGQKVVHRDIKPANLMYDAASDRFKITDFGIARLTDTSRTKTGIILGTPSYMSPEQLCAQPVTGRSDLYSLGITMYQLLAGHAPFRADSIPKLMDKIMNDRHQPISEVRADLPAAVDELLDQILAKDPDHRFPNGRTMALALRECCSSFS